MKHTEQRINIKERPEFIGRKFSPAVNNRPLYYIPLGFSFLSILQNKDQDRKSMNMEGFTFPTGFFRDQDLWCGPTKGRDTFPLSCWNPSCDKNALNVPISCVNVIEFSRGKCYLIHIRFMSKKIWEIRVRCGGNFKYSRRSIGVFLYNVKVFICIIIENIYVIILILFLTCNFNSKKVIFTNN